MLHGGLPSATAAGTSRDMRRDEPAFPQFRIALLGALLLILPVAASLAAPSPVPVRPSTCADVPDFASFEAELKAVAAKRDGTALRRLFSLRGRMRVNGVGGLASGADWRLTGKRAVPMWDELDQILALGCVRVGDRLLLPAVAIRAKEHTLTEDHVVGIEPVSLRKTPSFSAKIVQKLPLGSAMVLLSSDATSGWSEVRVGEQRYHARSAALRSPFGTQLELIREDGAWRILHFGSGI